MKNLNVFFTLILLLFSIACFSQDVVYVDQNASGTNDGSSWENAYLKIEDALIIPNTGKEIWIAKGTYSPSNSSRTGRYHLYRSYKFYGNFAGDETSKNQRIDTIPHIDGSYRTNETIISGDIGTTGINTDNIANFFVIDDGENFIPTVTFDALTIEDGYSNIGTYRGVASAIYSNNAQLVLNNMLFKNNTVISEYSGLGGAVYSNSYAIVKNSIFLNNHVSTIYANTSHIAKGGAICLDATGNISNSYFTNNSATAVNSNGEGGAIYISETLTMYHSILTNNYAKTNGGAIKSDAASYFRNCLISKNTASLGGGAYLNYVTDILNTTISCNYASSFAGGIWFQNTSNTYKITNSIIWGNIAPTFPEYRLNVGTTNFTYSLIPGFSGGTNNIDTDPLFIDTLASNFRLSELSPCKDVGNNSAVTAVNPSVLVDLDGNLRIANTTIDMGAFEALVTVYPVADFIADNTIVTVGDNVSFTDLSTDATEWNWDFAVGEPIESCTPNFSTNQNPSVTYNLPGTYTVKLIAQNNFGSDDEEKTDYITVHPVYEFLDAITICESDTVTWRDNPYWNSGTYTDSLLTYFGADSVYVLHLTVNPIFESVDSEQICDGNIYTWRGNDYGIAGTYHDSLTTQHGCDSVYILHLSVNPLPEVSINDLDTVYCDYHSPVTMMGTPQGGSFYGEGVSGNIFDPDAAGLGIWTITYSYTDTNGCSNTDTVHVTVSNCVGIGDIGKQDIEMYPNPSNNYISFTNTVFDDVEIKIFNQSGQLINSYKNKNHIFIGNLSTGIYYVQMIAPNNVKIWKLMKE